MRVARTKDFSHPAGTEAIEDLVVGNLLAQHVPVDGSVEYTPEPEQTVAQERVHWEDL